MAPQLSPTSSVKQARRQQPSPGRRKGTLSAPRSHRWSSSGLSNSARDVCDEQKRVPVNKALLIGIQYEENEDHGNLMAAHEDVGKVKKMLIELYKYEEKNITVLLDDAAREHRWPTYANILKAIEDLLSGVQEGDTLYFHYSGHGEQVPCRPEDVSEDDGKDEAIVPCDATEEADTWILDNTLNDKLVKQLPVGAYLFAVFDMCHSGTALDLNNYDYPCNSLLKKCTRKVTAGVRKMSSVFTRTTYRTASEAQWSAPTSRKPSSKKSTERCVVITSERLSLAKVKSRKLSVDIQEANPASLHAAEDVSTPIRRCTLSQSEKAYVLQYQADTSTGTDYALAGAVSMYGGRSIDDRMHSSHTLIPQQLPAIFESTTEVDSHSALRHMTHPSSPPFASASVKRTPSPLSFVWLLARKLVRRIRRLKRNSKGAKRKEAKGEWNVFSAEGLTRRKETIRKPLSRIPTGAETIAEKQVIPTPVLQSGIMFESPPCSPSTPRGFDFFPRRASRLSIPELQTGQVVSIAAANDAQLAMEYMDKEKGMKSLTATLVEILYTNPHPTIGNLMSDLSSWLQKSSEDMHKYFEDRKARYDAKARDPNLLRPRSPRNTQEKEWVRQEDEMQEMVLRTKPVQQPVVGTQLKINIDKENILPFLLPSA